MANNTDIAELHADVSSEKVTGFYKTGMIDISKYDRPRHIRRINLNYESSDLVSVNVFADGYTSSNKILTLTFPANILNSGPRIVSLRPPGGARAKTIAVNMVTNNANGSCTIRKMEIEVDE